MLAFIAEGRSLSLDTLPDWGLNVPGVVVVQKCTGATPDMKTIIRGVCLRRIEIRPTVNRQGVVYVPVIQAINPTDLLFSHDMLPLRWALQQHKEVYLIWHRVPYYWEQCYHCNADIKLHTAAFFEGSVPICSPYCTLLKK